MGAKLIPIARNFAISREVFTVGSPDVLRGCVAPGPHRLLRFDVLCHNAGDVDLVIGSPEARPDLFEFSVADQRYYLHDFVHVALTDGAGETIAEGHKRSFCLMDIERIEPRGRDTPQFHDCNANQGISAGWADVYRAQLPCQYLVIDDLPDGSYHVRVDIDAQRVLPDGPAESTVTLQLHLGGDSVVALGPADPPASSGPPDPEPPSSIIPLPSRSLPPQPAPSPPQPAPSPPQPAHAPPYVGSELSALEVFAHVVIDSRDVSAVARYLAPVFVGHGLVLDRSGRAIDAARYQVLLGELFAAFVGLRTTFGARLTEHDWVAASWTRTGLHVAPFGGIPASRRPIEIRGVTIARLERGLIAEQWDVVDPSWLSRIGGPAINALEPPG